MEYVNEGLPAFIEVDSQRQGVLLRSRGNTLDDVYGRYSTAKAAAYVRCMELCDEMDGSNLCITSATTCFFSAQFEFTNPMNGRPMVCHIMPYRTCAMYTDMPSISAAKDAWMQYVRSMRYLSVHDCDGDVDIDGASIRWMCGSAYVRVDDEIYRVIDPLTKNGGLRVRAHLRLADVVAAR